MADAAVIEMANKLAEECLAVQSEIGNDRLFMEIGAELGTSSQTLEEAFLTAIRTRMAEQKGRALLARRLREYRAQSAPASGAQ
ncbi:hypothetical protein ACFSUD_06780 [Sulfitobacter aestuarii]|uniref:Uncharacterized protein n=1 Tax=Sulfitobacter aestuarii TaxID=2161676 RepID=A0ABW5U0F6_9RHOB